MKIFPIAEQQNQNTKTERDMIVTNAII